MKKLILIGPLAFSLSAFGQNIIDNDGNNLNYKKIGGLYWSDNIKTTTLWKTNSSLKQIDKAPTPGKDYTGALYIDAKDKYRFSNRYYSISDSNYYYTWNTANNTTALKWVDSKFEELKDKNESICPCGWRVPSFNDLGNALVSLRVFSSKDAYNKWLYDDGIFNSKFLLSQQMASASKEGIPKTKLLDKFFSKEEMAGVYGIMGMDDTKPLLKDMAIGLWLRNIGVSFGPDMQMDGAMMLISSPKGSPNSLQLVIKSEFSTELASVKCVTDLDGLEKYKVWKKELDQKLRSSTILDANIDSLISLGQFQNAYKKIEKSLNENEITGKLATPIYNKWHRHVVESIDKLISQEKLKDANELIAFFSQKVLSTDKNKDAKLAENWSSKIKSIEYKIALDELKKKPLTEIEIGFTGKWLFQSKSIYLKNGEIYKLEEVWNVNSDRTYTYESRFKKFAENTYLGEYLEKGVFEIKKDNFGSISVVVHISEEDGKPSTRIDELKFDTLTDKKASRTLNFNEAKYPAKTVGKKQK